MLTLSKKGLKPAGEVSVLSASLDPNLKRIKVEQNEMEVDQSLDQPIASIWVKFPGTRIQLFADDKMMIEEHHQLNDRHINFVQAMLRAQFLKCDGLKNTLLQDRVRLTIANKIVQILHIHNNHWVVISNMHCSGEDLSMYETVYDDIDASTMALVSSIFEENVNISIVPQVGRCRLWCIQYCYCHFIVTWFISWPI